MSLGSMIRSKKKITPTQADKLVWLRKSERAAKLVYEKFQGLFSKELQGINQNDEQVEFFLECKPATTVAIFYQWLEKSRSQTMRHLSIVILEKLLTSSIFSSRRNEIISILREITRLSSPSSCDYLIKNLTVNAILAILRNSESFTIRHLLEDVNPEVSAHILRKLRKNDESLFEQIMEAFTPEYALAVEERIKEMDLSGP